MRRWQALWSVGLALAIGCVVPSLAAAASEPPRVVVEQTIQQVLDTLEENAAVIDDNPDAVEALVADIVLPRFDFELMSRFVLGQHWRQADSVQREAFTAAFRDLLVRTYISAIDEYSGEDVQVPAQRIPDDADRVSVQTEIVRPDGPSIPVAYALFLRDEQWKVFDVTVEGVSLVQNYRAQFSDIVRADGLDELIERVSAGVIGDQP
ncbi:MAG: ABC transporter substrate-binding protein [Spiribacter sp.]|nr:ABC transporter substrate-binding protein [Spiribacter sp.]